MNRWVKRLLIACGALAMVSFMLGTLITVKYGRPRVFYIPSCAMAPTLEIGDRIVVGKRRSGIERGDIVVFRLASRDLDTVKRVVGVGGDRLEFKEDRVWVNGRPADEPYLASGTVTFPHEPVDVPDGSYYMLGDNRRGSSDSRVFGPVDEDNIVGRMIWKFGRGDDCGG